jgi:hypothetical protein
VGTARVILVVFVVAIFHFMLQLITILNSHEESLTPEDENAGLSWSRPGGIIESPDGARPNRLLVFNPAF